MIFQSASPHATEVLARTLSLFARPGFVILLKGDLGAGKSTFARAFIKALAPAVPEFDVPSPSFALIQTYDNTRLPVAHVDLYRLRSPEEVLELGLDELAASHLILAEWPSHAMETLSQDTLLLEFSGHGESRSIMISAKGAWGPALARNAEIEAFLEAQGVDPATRRFLDGDASSRRYEKVIEGAREVILMDMPQRPDGPPVKDGKPYSAIAHLAEGITAVVAVNDQLVSMGYGAPQVYACDTAKGLALIEDLGSAVYAPMMRRGEDMEQPMRAAVEVLADMAVRDWPATVPVRGAKPHQMPSYDQEAQLIEVDLLPSWFHVHVHKTKAPESLNESFAAAWREVLPFTVAQKPVWVLRDYHSPNLIWLPERRGLKRVGLIDTQDALLGHPAYDLASMLQDARVDIAFDFADRLFAHYVALRHAQGSFDEAGFARAYAILGAQRATKILGIFARLNMRDGKPQYLQHMPRVSRYLARGLQHLALQGLRQWYERHMPAALEIGKA
ncbi:MAG: tRNA (adenosine(37)-N6)-threonylcarbamoyltransferase complex ATPase subunit type 1 TsaE [Alphaproteobacteria bacterium]|nr:tRNA (adenosine(37)-N6)-threonylcarbamoyltransferase complex ATPase subunit type 1 TsaE [Alphaproteobacteria bacterium]